MGYDITLYVVEKTNSMNDGKYYAQEIARFDMFVFPELARFMADEPPTDCYFYADDGNTHVVEDRYGSPLTETEVSEMIYFLEDVVKNTYWTVYRRIPPVLAALKAIKQQIDEGVWKNVVVLRYGS